MSLIFIGNNLYCNTCHPENGSKLDGMVETIVNDRGIVMGFTCDKCHRVWRVI